MVLHIESSVIMCRSKYFKETRMSDYRQHKGTGHIMDSKSPGTPKYYHGRGGSYREITHQKNPSAGMSKPSKYSMGRSQAKSLLTQKAKASVPLGGMNWGNILTRGGLKMLGVLGAVMSPSKTVSADQEKKHMKQGY